MRKTEILALGSWAKWPRRCSAAEGTAACGARGRPPGLACSVPGTCARARLKRRAPARAAAAWKNRAPCPAPLCSAALQRLSPNHYLLIVSLHLQHLKSNLCCKQQAARHQADDNDVTDRQRRDRPRARPRGRTPGARSAPRLPCLPVPARQRRTACCDAGRLCARGQALEWVDGRAAGRADGCLRACHADKPMGVSGVAPQAGVLRCWAHVLSDKPMG